jgi:hypothetical protein
VWASRNLLGPTARCGGRWCRETASLDLVLCRTTLKLVSPGFGSFPALLGSKLENGGVFTLRRYLTMGFGGSERGVGRNPNKRFVDGADFALLKKLLTSLWAVEIAEHHNGLRYAFHELAKHHHPDRVGVNGIPLFQQIVEAYRTLSDSGRRENCTLGLTNAVAFGSSESRCRSQIFDSRLDYAPRTGTEKFFLARWPRQTRAEAIDAPLILRWAGVSSSEGIKFRSEEMFELTEYIEITLKIIAMGILMFAVGFRAGDTSAQESSAIVGQTRTTETTTQRTMINRPAPVETDIEFQKARLDPAQADLQKSWSGVIAADPSIAHAVARKPALLSDQSYLDKHPPLRDFVASHPDFPDQFATNPGNFVAPN